MSAPSLQAIRAVGGLVPPGLLARIQAGELSDSAGLTPASYHLAGRETVRDAASRAWSYLRGAWTAWREYAAAQPPAAAGTGPARERWLLVLLRELGYGQVPALTAGPTIGDREYPVSHTWQHVPIHLLGPGVDLDRRNPGVAGAARAPQTMVQELLNRADDHLWAILSNGSRLRLLRDSTALAGSAYLEFDLEAIFDGELYPEFLLMWQLCHVSRLEKRGADATPADCWLEAWRGEAVEAGTRMLDRLRDGVEVALTALGTGFLRHPQNGGLVDALRSGQLSTQDYHRLLLRLVYRLLFCFVAEDRGALLHPDATVEARDRYHRFFSTTRLRRLSRTRFGSPHGDLWHAVTLVIRALGNHGEPRLGLPGLAGLFDPDPRAPAIASLGAEPLLACSLASQDLLGAVRHLGWLSVRGRRTQPVDYRNLGAEELGSVYESLLELVPRIDLAERTFTLDVLAGNERKTTGSYYTPPSLVSVLLDTTLDPLIEEAAADRVHAEARLLALTVCDPACGSGHFLVAAARRIARKLAEIRSDEDEPTPEQVRHALREVIGRCIYGVDLNDLAAELAKVSLWLEALEPGKPLGFLDARIRVGNSLLGATPALLRGGVPDGAFKEFEGDDRELAAAIRKRNKEERRQGVLFVGDVNESNVELAEHRRAALALLDDVDAVRGQARVAKDLEGSPVWLGPKIHADTWCAAFVWNLERGDDALAIPTTALIQAIGAEPFDPAFKRTKERASALADAYRFFHWHLEFPEIFHVGDPDAGPVRASGWAGGFSFVGGNPPWDRVKLQEKEFFAARRPDIANAPNAAARKKMIIALKDSESATDQALHAEWHSALRVSDGVSTLIRESGRYPLTATGDINTYAIFAEAARAIMSRTGRLGMILPTGIATDATTQRFFRDLIERRSLDALLDFVTNPKLWTDVGNRRYRFCFLSLVGEARIIERAEFATLVKDPLDLPPRGQRIAIPPDDLLLVNPNTGTCPMFVTKRDADITIGIYRRVPVLWRDGAHDGNPWGLAFMAMLHMANDSEHFRTAADLESDDWVLRGNVFERGRERMLPLYEAKLTHQFDHRLSCYSKRQKGSEDTELPRITAEEKRDPSRVPVTRYWVAEGVVEDKLAADSARGKPGWVYNWLLGWRNITNVTNERTVIAAVVPRTGVGDTFPLIMVHGNDLRAVTGLLANLNSYCVDYASRQSLSGIHLTHTVMKQLPMLPPSVYVSAAPWDRGRSTLGDWIRHRALELTYTSFDLGYFARDVGDDGSPFIWDVKRRVFIKSELDAAYFHLYDISRGDVQYIMNSFAGVRGHDESSYGEYLTERLILERYDAMRAAIDTGVPYETPLDPPPGHGPRHPPRREPR